MNDSIEIFKEIYKPYRLTKKKGVTIASTTSGNYVIKNKSNNHIKELYTYLLSRNFDYFPKLIDGNRDDINVYEYLDDTIMPIEQKANDMISLVALLHSKTAYYKEVTTSLYQEIYENIVSNINDVKLFYDELIDEIKFHIYPSPSEYMLLRNSSKLYDALEYSLAKINDWYDSIKETNKQRVATIHNNLTIDHFIKKDNGYLISWEKSKIDSPVLDLIELYKNDYLKYDFSEIMKKYQSNFGLLDNEFLLFYSVITIPFKYESEKEELINCYKLRKILDYIYKTEIFIEEYQKE